jgi:subtilisin family serine protease
MVIAVAAGNSGPAPGSIESPGSAARALTAGASSVPHFIGAPVMANGNTYGAAAGQFATVTNDLSAPLGVVLDNGSLSSGCAALADASLAGKVALIARGACSFSAKIRNAQAAGAVAVLVVNNVLGDPVAMASDLTPDQPTIPAYMLSFVDGMALSGADGTSVTIGATMAYFQSANADLMADFSSRGPTRIKARIKPDVVAPGVNVLSSIPVAFCGGAPCWAFFEGTSMATPHLAGSAAIVRWLHPDWSAAQVRSAVVNTADANVLTDPLTGGPVTDVNIVGSGRENLLSAVNAAITLDPVSVSFGEVPAASGRSDQSTVTLNNVTTNTASYSVAVDAGDTSVSYFVTPTTVSLDAGKSATVTIQMFAVKGAALGGHQSKLTISSAGGELAHAAVFTLIK